MNNNNNEAILIRALRYVIKDIEDYQRTNNLYPDPGKKDCWQSVTHAKEVIALIEGPLT